MQPVVTLTSLETTIDKAFTIITDVINNSPGLQNKLVDSKDQKLKSDLPSDDDQPHLSDSELLTIKQSYIRLKLALELDDQLYKLKINKKDRKVSVNIDSYVGKNENKQNPDEQKMYELYQSYKTYQASRDYKPLPVISPISYHRLKTINSLLKQYTNFGILNYNVYITSAFTKFDNIKSRKSEENRHYYYKLPVVGNEPWIISYNSDIDFKYSSYFCDYQQAVDNFAILTNGLGIVLNLKGKFDVNPDGSTKAHGYFLTGSLVTACLRKFRFTCNSQYQYANVLDNYAKDELLTADGVNLFYPAIYTDLISITQDGENLPPTLYQYRKLLTSDNLTSINIDSKTGKQKLEDGSTLSYPIAGDIIHVKLTHDHNEDHDHKQTEITFIVSNGADIDIMVACEIEQMEEMVQKQLKRIRLVYPAARLTKIDRPNSVLYQIDRIPRVIQMYHITYPGYCIQHHVDPARAFMYDNGDSTQGPTGLVFKLMPSAFDTINSKMCKDLRYVLSKHSPADIMVKYAERGWGFSLSSYFGWQLIKTVNEIVKDKSEPINYSRLSSPCLKSSHFNFLTIDIDKMMFGSVPAKVKISKD